MDEWAGILEAWVGPLGRRSEQDMPDLSQDLVINVVHNQIKKSIRLLLDERCFGAAVLLILSGVDTMAYLGMPASQSDVAERTT